ncbi:MAG: chloride channel protein [Telluria sp.]
MDFHTVRPHAVKHALQREVGDWRLWWERVAVLATAAVAGLVVVWFTWLGDRAFAAFLALAGWWRWAPLVVAPLLTAGLVWATRRWAAGASGSGIPQVMAALEPAVDARSRGLYVSLRLTLAKIALTAGSLLAGLSAGREGPSVQVAAGILLQVRRFVPWRSTLNVPSLLVAGGAAGIAAAFNTPLGGVMFAIEELARAPEKRSSGVLIAAIVLAGLIGVSLNGNGTYFGIIHAGDVTGAMLLPGLCVAILAGVAGGLFARVTIASLRGDGRDLASRLRRRHPVVFAGACGLAIAVIGLASQGATFGSGYGTTRAMLEGHSVMPLGYLVLKFAATWITTWSGVAAGIFAPALAIGAAIGNDVAVLLHHPHAPQLIALGMAGFLAAVTQAPLTAFIIVMEMVDGHAMVLSLMACALLASLVSRLVSPPLYAELARLQLGRLPRAEPAA